MLVRISGSWPAFQPNSQSFISTSGPDPTMSHSLTLSVTSTHSHTCAHVPVLMHTHNTHTRSPGPTRPCLLPWGITWGAPRRQGFLGLHAECPRGYRGGGRRGVGGIETLQGSPWVWAELLGSPSSFSGSPTSPLPTDNTPPPPHPRQSFALRTCGRKWHLDPPSCSVFTGVQDGGLALCHGAARKKASFPWHSY